MANELWYPCDNMKSNHQLPVWEAEEWDLLSEEEIAEEDLSNEEEESNDL